MCKSENSVGGVGGTAANRRKAVLKEIWEACLLANTALGGTMQMQMQMMDKLNNLVVKEKGERGQPSCRLP